MTELSVGIDLGTTNSCISTCWPNGQPRLLRDEAGVGVIPSVVSFADDGSLSVGQKARMRLLSDPENTFFSIKRFIGRDMRTDENRWAVSQYPYALEAGPNGIPTAVTRGRRLPAYQISGHVLAHLKEVAETSLGQPVDKAVITVPANFNEVQRRSTHQAGEFAGFEVLRIFNEPTAAALAYGLGKDRRQDVAVFDFGGGTFDITILRLEDPVFEVLSTSGDMLLGGDDFDRRLLEDMFEHFRQEYGASPENDTSLVQRFTLGAERMKCQLTDWIVTAFEDRHVRAADGTSLPPFHYEINRDRFQALVGELVERSFEVCDRAFEEAGVGPKEIDQVILVGGTTRVPLIRQKVNEYFGRRPLDKIQPDVVVSIGAAIQAFSLAGGELIYPAAARDMLPIRKMEARPPAPKPQSQDEFALLDDLSDAMEQDEKHSLEKLKSPGRTVPGTPVIQPRPSGPPRPSRSQPPAPPPGRAAPSGPPAAPVPAVPLGESPAAEDLPQVQASPPVPLPESPDDLELVMPDGRLESEAPGSTLRVESVVPPVTPAPSAAPEPPAAPGSTLRVESVVPPVTPAEPAVQPAARADPLAQTAWQPESAGAAEQTPFEPEPLVPLAPPDPTTEQAPLVTPEQTAQMWVSQDVADGVREAEREQEAAPEPAFADEAGIAPLGPSSDAPLPPAPDAEPARAPLLLDVTANTLGVRTVGGFVEVLVHRNSPVPIEKHHMFTTSADDQDRAVIRVLEGESSMADENNVLGEVELTDIRKAPRGEIKIEVVYEITVDGILQVSAHNTETGERQTSRLTLFGG